LRRLQGRCRIAALFHLVNDLDPASADREASMTLQGQHVDHQIQQSQRVSLHRRRQVHEPLGRRSPGASSCASCDPEKCTRINIMDGKTMRCCVETRKRTVLSDVVNAMYRIERTKRAQSPPFTL
jgi:hypothetical protein